MSYDLPDEYVGKAIYRLEADSEEEMILGHIKDLSTYQQFERYPFDFLNFKPWPIFNKGLKSPINKDLEHLRKISGRSNISNCVYQGRNPFTWDGACKHYSNRIIRYGGPKINPLGLRIEFGNSLFTNCTFIFHITADKWGKGVIKNMDTFIECKFVNCKFIFKQDDDVEEVIKLGKYIFTACYFQKCRISDETLKMLECYINGFKQYTYNRYDNQMIVRLGSYSIAKFDATDPITRRMFHSVEVEMYPGYGEDRRSTLYIPQDEGDNIHQQMEDFIKTFYAVYGDDEVNEKAFHILSQRQGLYVIKDRQLVKKDIIKMKPKAFWKLLKDDGIEFNLDNIQTMTDLEIVSFDGMWMGTYISKYEWEGDEYGHDDRIGYSMNFGPHADIPGEGFEKLPFEEGEVLEGVDIINTCGIIYAGGLVNNSQYFLGRWM